MTEKRIARKDNKKDPLKAWRDIVVKARQQPLYACALADLIGGAALDRRYSHATRVKTLSTMLLSLLGVSELSPRVAAHIAAFDPAAVDATATAHRLVPGRSAPLVMEDVSVHLVVAGSAMLNSDRDTGWLLSRAGFRLWERASDVKKKR